MVEASKRSRLKISALATPLGPSFSGGGRLDGDAAQAKAGQIQALARSPLQTEHHLEERRSRQIPLGVELLDQALEG